MPTQLQDSHLLKTQAYINGQWLNADSSATFAVSNPANGKVIAEVANLGANETHVAIESAFSHWPLI